MATQATHNFKDFICCYRCLCALALFAALFAVSGCDKAAPPVGREGRLPESEEPLYVEARNLAQSGRDRQAAIEKFQQVIDARNGDAPFSHYLKAGLCLQENEPILAIYHLKQFVRLHKKLPPGAKDSHGNKLPSLVEAQNAIILANRMYAEKLTADAIDTTGFMSSRADLDNKIRDLTHINNELKKEKGILHARIAEQERTIADLKRRAARTVPGGADNKSNRNAKQVDEYATRKAVPAPPESARVRTVPQTYTVVQGDTLLRISQKVYGVGTRYNEIYNANRDRIPDKNRLKIGTVLRIPRPDE